DMVEMVEGYLERATPKQRAALPKELRTALAKYGSYSKIPKAERAKVAGAALAQLNGLTADMGDQINEALSGGGIPGAGVPPRKARSDDASPPPDAPKSADAWFARHAVKPPGFDAKHANVDQIIAFGLAEA